MPLGRLAVVISQRFGCDRRALCVGDGPSATTDQKEDDGTEAEYGGHEKCDVASTEAHGHRRAAIVDAPASVASCVPRHVLTPCLAEAIRTPPMRASGSNLAAQKDYEKVTKPV
jgi:hypothetical protein